MKKGRLFSFGFALLAATAFAQSSSEIATMNSKARKAYSVPISKKEMQLQITEPSGDAFTIQVREGGMAKISNLKDGWAYALVPVLTGIDDKTAVVHVYRLTQDSEGNESIAELEQAQASLDSIATTKAEPQLQIKLAGVVEPNTADSRPSKNGDIRQVAILMGPHRDCCVTCANITACGDAVCASCGSCNDPGSRPIPNCPPAKP